MSQVPAILDQKISEVSAEKPSVDAIQEVLNKEILELSDEDLTTLVAGYRTQRANWLAEEAKAKADAKRTNHRVTRKKVTLEELGL